MNLDVTSTGPHLPVYRWQTEPSLAEHSKKSLLYAKQKAVDALKSRFSCRNRTEPAERNSLFMTLREKEEKQRLQLQ